MTLKTKEELNKLLSKRNESEYLKSLTDEQWQELVSEIRTLTTPTTYEELPMMECNPKIINRKWWLSDEDKLVTQDTRYRNYINDILDQIKLGLHDYCYHIYHIADLLKFYPDALRTRLIDGYIEVWLER